MKLLVLSDLHLEFEPFELDGNVEFDVVILAGDIHSPGRHAVAWAAECFPGKPVVLVAGDHEYFGSEMHEGSLRCAAKPRPCASASWTATKS